MKDLNVFTNVQDKPIQGTLYGSQVRNLQVLQAGAGAKSMRADDTGLWLGAEAFGDAPFSVDMDGNLIATSLTASGYIQVGGAASDVNSGATTISGGKITALSVTSSQIAAGAITTAKIAAGAVTANEIFANTITSDELASNSVTTSKINTGAITTAKIAAGAITATEIAAGAVTATKISASSITTDKLQANSVIASKISVSNLTDISTTFNNTGSGVVKGNQAFFLASLVSGGADRSSAYDFDTYTAIIRTSLDMDNGNITDIDGLIFNSSTQYIDHDSDDMFLGADDEIVFYSGGSQRFRVHSSGANITGDFSATGSKSFLIEHPTKPDHLLRYHAQESPEVLLRHRGRVDVDVSLVVDLPDHFIGVTEDTALCTINLTPHADARVWLKSVNGNASFEIGASKPVTVDYEFIAVRKGFLDYEIEIPIGENQDLINFTSVFQEQRENTIKEKLSKKMLEFAKIKEEKLRLESLEKKNAKSQV